MLLALGFLVGVCTSPPTQTPPVVSETPQQQQTHLQLLKLDKLKSPPSTPLVSEVLTGIQGNNVFEFIELYNPTDQPVDLRG